MEPMPQTIRYATTSDDMRIAFASIGEPAADAPPLLCLPPFPFSHAEAGWDLAGQRRWYERLARRIHVVTYDSRGTGLSERSPAEFTIEAMLRDLEAVRARLGWGRFAVCGLFNAAPVAIAYAARQPEAVSALVLWGGFARGPDIYPMALPASAAGAADIYWPVLVEMAARTWTADSAEAAEVAAFFQRCVDPDTALRAFAAAREYDVSALLTAVHAPTLVLHRPHARAQRPDLGPALAAAIPDAVLAPLDGHAASPFAGDPEPGISAIERFLGVGGLGSGGDLAQTPLQGDLDSLAEALTPREVEVLRLVARGLANKEIALALDLSIHTVERHLTNLFPKIGCRSRTEATAFALTHGYR